MNEQEVYKKYPWVKAYEEFALALRKAYKQLSPADCDYSPIVEKVKIAFNAANVDYFRDEWLFKKKALDLLNLNKKSGELTPEERRNLQSKIRELKQDPQFEDVRQNISNQTKSDIDPFSIFGFFNVDNVPERLTLAQELMKQFGVDDEVVTSFDYERETGVGIPIENRAHRIKNLDIEDREKNKELWNLFCLILEWNPRNGDIDQLASKIKKIEQNINGFSNSRIYLYWVQPRKFLPLDSRSTQYLASPKFKEKLKAGELKNDINKYLNQCIEISNQNNNNKVFPFANFIDFSAAAFEFSKRGRQSIDGNDTKDGAITSENNDMAETNEGDEIRHGKDELVNHPRNLIYFGAPGTGKSHKLNEDVKAFFDDRYERVTFYPTYSYAQFVGCYKPVMKGTNAGDKKTEEISYEFVPGPFLRVLVKALERPGENHCLVIEEINRANAAAVFGDVFQLLDRATEDSKKDERVKKGESEYGVAASEDIRRYLTQKIGSMPETKYARTFLEVENPEDGTIALDANGNWASCRLRIPSNMYIWATMNSADQGVFPMDTAFKRRWEFRYFGIDEGEGDCAAWTIEGCDYKWNDVRKIINGLLSLHGVNEDKLMGAHFVTATNNRVSAQAFASKILMYLWEDAARMCRRQMFGNITTYSQLVVNWKDMGVKVFKETQIENLEDNLKQWYEEVAKQQAPAQTAP